MTDYNSAPHREVTAGIPLPRYFNLIITTVLQGAVLYGGQLATGVKLDTDTMSFGECGPLSDVSKTANIDFKTVVTGNRPSGSVNQASFC